MNFLVFGSGAIGGYVGGSLALAGHNVTLIARPAQAEIINRRGLNITHGGATRTASNVTAAVSAAEAFNRNHYDSVFLAVKSFDTDSAVVELLAASSALPPMVCLQNGVDNESKLAAAFGAERVIAGTALSAVGAPQPGEIVVEKNRGAGLHKSHPLSAALAEALNGAGVATQLYENAQAMKWTKLLTNIMANATAAICDLSTEAVFNDAGLYRIEVAALKEALAVMGAKHLPVVPLPRTPTRALAFALRSLPPDLYRSIFRRAIGRGRGGKRPSLHMDLSAGKRRTEVSYLNGAVARHAEAMGLNAPVNRALTQLLEAIVAGSVAWEKYRRRPQRLVQEIESQE